MDAKDRAHPFLVFVVQFQPLPATFEPEYLTAFEIGTKNSFDGGRLTLNATGFYYDYQGYQISKIVDRISLNENFDATVWGLEFEAAWRPSRAFRLDTNLGYLKTRLKEGAPIRVRYCKAPKRTITDAAPKL